MLLRLAKATETALVDESHNHINKSNIRYTMENGMRMVYLDEVEVVAKKNEKSQENFSYYMPTNAYKRDILTEEQLEEIQPISLSDAVMHFPFVTIHEGNNGKRTYINRMRGAAVIIIDDIIMRDGDMDAMIDPFIIEKKL